jgi:hypothetical protein
MKLKSLSALLAAVVLAVLGVISSLPALAQTVYRGQYVEASCGSSSSSTVAFTNATPTVGTWASPPWTVTGGVTNITCPIIITGTAPTGLSTATNYWAVPISLSAGTFNVASSAANALAGTFLATTGSTTTSAVTSNLALTTTAGLPTVGIALPAGDWDCMGSVFYVPATSTSVTNLQQGISTTATSVGSLGAYTDWETAANVVTGTNNPLLATPVVRQTVSSSGALVYGVALGTFTVSTLQATGDLRCRKSSLQG